VAAERVRDLSSLARRKMIDSSHQQVRAAKAHRVNRRRGDEYVSRRRCAMFATVQTVPEWLVLSLS